MGNLSAEELAELVPCSVEDVSRLEELGVLQAHDGAFASADVHVTRLMTAFEDAGIALEDVARAAASGELSFPLGSSFPSPWPFPPTTKSWPRRWGVRPSFSVVSARSSAFRPERTTACAARTRRCCHSC